jgi:hypothetical protein
LLGCQVVLCTGGRWQPRTGWATDGELPEAAQCYMLSQYVHVHNTPLDYSPSGRGDVDRIEPQPQRQRRKLELRTAHVLLDRPFGDANAELQ